MKRTIRPLSGRGKDIECELRGAERVVRWGETAFVVPERLIEDVLTNYFKDPGHWYPLGAGMDAPVPGGLGEYVSNHSALTPRHASAVAAMLVDEGRLECRGRKPIELKKAAPKRTLS